MRLAGQVMADEADEGWILEDMVAFTRTCPDCGQDATWKTVLHRRTVWSERDRRYDTTKRVSLLDGCACPLRNAT